MNFSTKRVLAEDYSFYAIAEKSQFALWLLQDDRFVYVNPKAAEIFGLTKDDLLSLPSFCDLVFEPDRDLVRENLAERGSSASTGRNFSFRGIRRSGQPIWVEVHCSLAEINGKAAILGTFVDIAEDERAAWIYRDGVGPGNQGVKSLTEREALYHGLFESNPQPIWIYDLETTRILSVNHAATQHYGYTREEFLGKTLKDLQLPGDADHPIGADWSVTGSLPRPETLRQRKKDGSLIDIETSTYDLSFEGRPARLVFAHDVTRQKQVERRHSQLAMKRTPLLGQLQPYIEQMPVGCILADAHFDFSYLNPAAERIFGFTRGELEGRSPFETIIPQSAHADVEDIRQRIAAGDLTAHAVTENLTKDGRKIICQWFNTPLRDASGKVTGVLALVQDITGPRQMEEALRKSELEYRHLVESVQAIVWKCDTRSFQFSFVNQQAEVLLGYPVARWMEETGFWEKHIFPGDWDSVNSTCKKVLTTLQTHEIEYRMIAADGRAVWLRDIIHPVVEDRQAKGLVGVMVDITARKSAELAMQESRARLESIINSAMDAIITVDADQRILIFNRAAETVFGCTADEAKGQLIDQFIPEKSHQAHRKHIANFGSTGITSRAMNALGNITGVRANGEEFPLEASISQTEVAGQKLYTVILRDITERKEAEEILSRTEQQLLQSQKMEAIGRLAGGVAHDFNNLLTGIIGFAEVTMARMERDDSLYDGLAEIHKAGERAAELTRQLLAFSRQQVLQSEVLDLNDVVNESTQLLRRLIGEDIELTNNLAPDLGHIKADRGQIGQVIMNLVVNARDAMPSGGKLVIETSNVYLDENYVSEHLSSSPGLHVMLAVSDSGIGMGAETKAHIFEPFFTTKEQGKGTGLGLATVYGVVQQSGGNIWVYSEPGEGTTFKVYFPCVNVSAVAARLKMDMAESPRGTETILIVEDEEIVRRLASQALGVKGYRILEAANGGEAEVISERYRDRIDMLLTDMIMPGVRGNELAARLLQHHPNMSVLYMSGHTENVIVQDGTLDANFNFLAKPFTPGTLTQRVRMILDSKKSPS